MLAAWNAPRLRTGGRTPAPSPQVTRLPCGLHMIFLPWADEIRKLLLPAPLLLDDFQDEQASPTSRPSPFRQSVEERASRSSLNQPHPGTLSTINVLQCPFSHLTA